MNGLKSDFNQGYTRCWIVKLQRESDRILVVVYVNLTRFLGFANMVLLAWKRCQTAYLDVFGGCLGDNAKDPQYSFPIRKSR